MALRLVCLRRSGRDTEPCAGGGRQGSAPQKAMSPPPTIDPNLPPPEVGVYWKDGARFVLIQGQALTSMKEGGRAGSIFTDGLRNQHWDSVLEGPTSRNLVREHRPTFHLYVPDGADSSDYVLIKLNKKGNRREFQVGSFGGITGGRIYDFSIPE